MIKLLSDYIKKFDYTGIKATLYYKEEMVIKSKIGGVLTLISGITFVLLIAGFGQDFFNRTNPTLIKGTVAPDVYTFWNITNKNFSFAFIFEDNDGVPMLDHTLFYPVIWFYSLVKNDSGVWEYKKQDILEYKNCSDDMFFDSSVFYSKKLKNWKCPIFNNLEVGGYWDSTKVNYIYFTINRCFEGEFNSKNEPCGSNEKAESLLRKQLFFSIMNPNVYVSPSDYNHPIKIDLVTKYKSLDPNSMKKSILYYYETQVTTDYGWLIESPTVFRAFGLRKEETDFLTKNLNNINDPYYNTYKELYLYWEKTKDEYKIEYQKIQSLVAQVGGILKIITTTATYLAFYYNNAIMEYEIIENNFSSSDKLKFYKINTFTLSNDTFCSDEVKSSSNNKYNHIPKKIKESEENIVKKSTTNQNAKKTQKPLSKPKDYLNQCIEPAKNDNNLSSFCYSPPNDDLRPKDNEIKSNIKLVQPISNTSSYKYFMKRISFNLDSLMTQAKSQTLVCSKEYQWSSLQYFINTVLCFLCFKRKLHKSFYYSSMLKLKSYLDMSQVVKGRILIHKIQRMLFTKDQRKFIDEYLPHDD